MGAAAGDYISGADFDGDGKTDPAKYYADSIRYLPSAGGGWLTISLATEAYEYDEDSGNLSKKNGVSYTYDTQGTDDTHAVVSRSNGDSYQYDANGNMTQRVVNGQTFNLGYDAENRLVSVSGALTASFVFDGDGKRVKSTVAGVTTYFVGNIYEKTGETETKYYYAGGSRIAMRVDGTLKYLLSDHLGSTTVVTDASGNLISELRYKPWGEVRSGSAPTDYTFTGQYSNVSDFGLLFYNARWYDPSLGRFTSADAFVPPGIQGYDRYAYVNNSPVNFTDPSGYFVVEDETCTQLSCSGDPEHPERPPKEEPPEVEPGTTKPPNLGILLEPWVPPPPDPALPVIHAIELFHLVPVDIIFGLLVVEAVAAGPAGWVGLALVSPVILASWGYTFFLIGELWEETGMDDVWRRAWE